MITFNNIGYMGRLGNQMFQMASTIGIARKLGYAPAFPIENFHSESPYSHTGCDLLECFDIPTSMLLNRNQLDIKFVYHENEFTYDPRTLEIPDYTDVNGYLQTEKYFAEIQDEIRRIFTFKKHIQEAANSIVRETDNAVSIHVRRGDYVASPDHHPTQSSDYYKKAISEFDVDSIFYIFSDDIEWCKEVFIGDKFRFIESGSPYVDMCIMTKLKNHIIANSSFSWWGSWLSGENSKVVSPSNWFGLAMNKNSSDIHCKNWKII
jgi:hypothetical protein